MATIGSGGRVGGQSERVTDLPPARHYLKLNVRLIVW